LISKFARALKRGPISFARFCLNLRHLNKKSARQIDIEVKVELARSNGHKPPGVPDVAPRLQTEWKELNALVWRMLMREATKHLQPSDVRLKKRCRKLGIAAPPAG
jgi:hypothetical protein